LSLSAVEGGVKQSFWGYLSLMTTSFTLTTTFSRMCLAVSTLFKEIETQATKSTKIRSESHSR